MQTDKLIQSLREIQHEIAKATGVAASNAYTRIAQLIHQIDREDSLEQIRLSLASLEANPGMDIVRELRRLLDGLEPF